MSYLESLFTKYGTDKGYLGGSGWGYTPAYEKYLAPRRAAVKRVLEIGICGRRNIPNNVVGASLFCWRDYFPAADVFGIDNDSAWIFNDQPRIRTALCNAYDPEQLHEAVEQFGGAFDFICDDAVHDPGPQVALLTALLPHLTPEGVYAIEDVGPEKQPAGNVENMIRLMPPDIQVEVFQTHKNERLLIITKNAIK